jgi:hydrogenase nickel incorporation protein HypA/HybF
MRAMHELALTDGVVQMVRERVGERRVTRVRLRVGKLVAIVPDAVRFCFDVCSRGTSLEGALLQIDEVAGRIHCAVCDQVTELDSVLRLCPCGSVEVRVLAGDELSIHEVEVT